MNQDKTVKGALLLLTAAISWGGTFPVGKAALSQMDGFYLALFRYGTASLIFLGILWQVEGKRSFSFEGKAAKVFFFGSVGFAGFGILFFLGLSYSTPEHGAIIMALMPLMTALINWFLKKNRPGSVTLICIGFALAGVSLVITKGNMDTLAGGGSVFGDSLLLLAALSWVVYTLGAQTTDNWSPLRYTALSSIPGASALLILSFAATGGGYAKTPSPGTIISLGPKIFYLVVIGTVFGVICWNSGIKLLGPLNGVLFINIVPVTAFAIGLIQGHHFTRIEILGAAITIGAVIINNLNARKRTFRGTPSTA